MPKIYKPREVISKFKKLGFVEDHQSGSHKVLYHPGTKQRAVILYHLKEILKGTLSAILREQEFRRKSLRKFKLNPKL